MAGGKGKSCEIPAEPAAQRYAVLIRTAPAEHHLGWSVRGRAGEPEGQHASKGRSPAPSSADAKHHRCPPPQQAVVASPGQARQDRVEQRTNSGKPGEDGPVHAGNDRERQSCPVRGQPASGDEAPLLAGRVRQCGYAVSAGLSGGVSQPPRQRCSPGSEVLAGARWCPLSAESPLCRQTRSRHCTAGSIPDRSVES